MNERYPIPADGALLHARHLHAETLFTLTEAGRAFRGSWGFFRPEGLARNERVNDVRVENDQVVITNLAMTTPDGFALRAKRLCSVARARGMVRLAWSLPEPNTKMDSVVEVVMTVDVSQRATPGERGGATIGTVVAEGTGAGAALGVLLTAPVFSLDGAEKVACTWRYFAGEDGPLVELASEVSRSRRGGAFERGLVSGVFQRVAGMPLRCEPGQAMWELESAFWQLANFAEAYAENEEEVVAETGALCDSVRKCREMANRLGPLCAGLEELTGRLKASVCLRNWLRTERLPLTPESTVLGAGRDKVLRYSVNSDLRELRIVPPLDVGAQQVAAWSKFDEGDWNRLMKEPDDAEWVVEAPGGATYFSLRCPTDVTMQVYGVL